MGKIYEKIKAKFKQAYHALKPHAKEALKKGANAALEHGKNYAMSKAKEHLLPAAKHHAMQLFKQMVPSLAQGGYIVHAKPGVGRVVRLHKGELVVPARKVRTVMRALRKAKVEVPISRRV
jgi:hypothetical protein